ncbi:unnamed protein product [Gadus morhua 'NCC']
MDANSSNLRTVYPVLLCRLPPTSWFDAQSYCRERGYDLATIDDMGAMKSLLGLSADKAHDELWIGLHYGGHKEWRWSLADKDFYQEGGRKYRNFEGSSETEMFVRQHNGKWYTGGIWTQLFFICYDGKEHTHMNTDHTLRSVISAL